jgi:hypothetical protein
VIDVKGRKIFLALDSKVLVVAVIGEVEDWTAYIGAVAGKDHILEMEQVASKGSKLPYELAKVIFPREAERYEWRD